MNRRFEERNRARGLESHFYISRQNNVLLVSSGLLGASILFANEFAGDDCLIKIAAVVSWVGFAFAIILTLVSQSKCAKAYGDMANGANIASQHKPIKLLDNIAAMSFGLGILLMLVAGIIRFYL